MAKQKSEELAPYPTVDGLVADLKARGGRHRPYWEVAGAEYPNILRQAVNKKLVVIAPDGALELAGYRSEKDKLKEGNED